MVYSFLKGFTKELEIDIPETYLKGFVDDLYKEYEKILREHLKIRKGKVEYIS